MEKKLYWILFALALLGVLDAGFLVFNEKTSTLPFCSINSSDDCSSVLESSYAYIGNLSVASIGLIHYSVLALTIIIMFFINKNFWKYFAVVLSTIGLLASAYFMFIQLFILKNICLFCTISAVISLSLFLLIQYFLKKERKKLFIYICDLFYKLIIRPILFKIDSEKIHEALIALGEKIGSNKIVQKSFHYLTRYEDKALYQNILGIEFISPIGLAAGFDYDARLTQFLPTLNFGFGTCGTITNMPYEGNPRPRLARLIKSKSLLVNKGFKSAGADKITQSLKNLNFEIPIGISIGRTNSPKLQTQRQSVEDIISAFKKFENVNIKNAYYELNISCPNLIYGNISFYPLENLAANQLLKDQTN